VTIEKSATSCLDVGLEEPTPPAAPVEGASDISEMVVRPTSGWRLINLGELWRYRELLYFLT
jgi:hypothetical protein